MLKYNREYRREYIKDPANVERIKAIDKKCLEKHKDGGKYRCASHRAWYEKNKEECQRKARENYHNKRNNKEK